MCHPEVPEGELAPPTSRMEVEIPVGAVKLPALLAYPDDAPRGAVLLLHDVFGRSPFYENLAARLALAGYAALLPDLFFREGPLPERTTEAASARRASADSRRLLQDALSAADWLSQRYGSPVGTIGFCMGGSYALAMAAERSGLATVCYYGFPGRAIHFTDDPSGPTPIDLAPRMRGPMIGFWGDQDQGAGMDNVAAFAQAMERQDKDFEHHVYPGAGHGFFAASGLDPDNALYLQACDSWTRTLTFLRKHIS